MTLRDYKTCTVKSVLYNLFIHIITCDFKMKFGKLYC